MDLETRRHCDIGPLEAKFEWGEHTTGSLDDAVQPARFGREVEGVDEQGNQAYQAPAFVDRAGVQNAYEQARQRRSTADRGAA